MTQQTIQQSQANIRPNYVAQNFAAQNSAARNKGRAVALGFFDGLHIGHAALMRRLLEVSNEAKLLPTVITFDTLPQNFINKKNIPLIISPDDRVGLIGRIFGIADVFFLRFNKDLALVPWDIFIDGLIIQYDLKHLIVGRNFKFGKGAKGNSSLLQQRCKEKSLGCDIISDVSYDGIVSSSTIIRKMLKSGEMERANAFLGHPHVLTDIVRTGQKIGGSLGRPTINMRFAPDVLVPAFGVYATKVYIEDSTDGLIGVSNIGVRPTVDSSGICTVETHILGYAQELYERNVRIEIYKRLRSEVKFKNTDELKAQIQRDCDETIGYFNS